MNAGEKPSRPEIAGPDEDPNVEGGHSSPPCFLHEIEPLDQPALLALLNDLLEAERAGARVVARLGRSAGDPAVAGVLGEVAQDEARFCAMLHDHVERLGGTPSPHTGAFHDKVLALDGLPARLDLVNRGQGWVVRRLRQALPRLADTALRRDLAEMLAVHERNIRTCAALPV